jgi:hypothetical protein
MTQGPVSVELSDDTAVGEGTLFSSSDPSPVTSNAGTSDSGTSDAGTSPVDAVSDVFGVAEGAPVWWIAVSVGPDVADAAMTFADGSTDEMAPVDGVVVLAQPIDPTVAAAGDGPDVVRGTLRLFDAAGSVVSSVIFPEPAPAPVPLPIAVPGSPPVALSGPATAPTPQTTEGVATTSCS